MSLWPSISGVALRIRSIRACTLGSIGWLEAAVGRTVMAVAISISLDNIMSPCLREAGACAILREPQSMTAMGHDLQEVMQFDPDDGIADLDQHLDRLKDA